MYRVYGDLISGNCYKIKLLMSLLEIPHEWQYVDILAGEARRPDFKAISLAGKVPLLKIDEKTYLSESNAILNFLAEGSDYLPNDRLEKAKVLQWQFFEQYSHEPYIAVARYINKMLGLPDDRRAEFDAKQEGGHKALQVMEEQLQQTDFLVGDRATIADFSLYAYTHVAHEGGFDLSPYASIHKWLKRIEDLPNFVAMPQA